MAQIYTDENFQSEVLNQKDKLFLIDFYADWCGPCQMLSPIVEQIAQEMKDKITVGKVDVDSSPETAGKYRVQSIPYLLFIKNGEKVAEKIGFASKDALEEIIDGLI